MLNGIQQQASLRLGTVRLGLRQPQEPTTRQKAQLNVDINAKNITVGKTRSALLTLRQQTAQDFLQIQYGTPLQALHRLGTDLRGILRRLVHTTQPRVQQSAGTNAEQTTHGTKRI